MKLTTAEIKKLLSEKLDVSEKDIKRLSKNRNEDRKVERVFDVDGQDVTVVSDEDDENILLVKTEEDEFDPNDNLDDDDFDEDSDMMGSSNPKDYVFAVSTNKDVLCYDDSYEPDGFAVIICLEKEVKNVPSLNDLYCDEREDDLLPDFLYDAMNNEGGLLFVNKDAWSVEKVVEEMKKKGFTYSNKLADRFEKYYSDLNLHRPVKAYRE